MKPSYYFPSCGFTMMDLLISKIFFFISSATTSCGSGFSLTVEGGRFQDEAV